MALELVHRPKSLKNIVGNTALVTQLNAAFKKKNRKHTILLHGPRGCGKTTIARILSGMAGCKEVFEMDIGNLRGIEHARELNKGLKAMPIFGGNKAYILDEVHMGTKEFFNALLKPIEEPPKHAYFFLCTTDPSKVITTIKSRCAQYEVESLSTKELSTLLNRIIKKENGDVDPKALKKIIANSEGVPREALIMLDQIITLTPEEQLEIAERSYKQEKQVKQLCQALLEGKTWKTIAGILKGLKDQEPESIRRAVLGYMNAVALGNNKGAFLIIDCFKEPFFNSGRAGLSLACYESIIE